MRKEAELWIKQALKDLEMAEKNFEIGGYYITAFLCHQSVEKGLKALYIVKFKRMPEKMHSLIALGREVEIPEEYFHILREMTPDFIISRYPDVIGEVPYEVYDKETAKERLENAKKVVDWILGEMKKLEISSTN